MSGEFLRKKFNPMLFFMFVCGLILIGFYFFFNTTDPEATSGTLTFLIFGVLIILFTIHSWFFNLGAYLTVDENSIKGKYHWFGKIDCKLTEISYAVARINTLVIRLRNGKAYTITGIKNPIPIASLIRESLRFEAAEYPEMLKEKLNALKAENKKRLLYVIIGVALMFINIFVTVFLTGEKEMHNFNKYDWIIFAVMSVIEILTVTFTFCLADSTGKSKLYIEELEYTLRRTIIESAPLSRGYFIGAYADNDYTARITIHGYPNQDAVYFLIEEFNSDYKLVRAYLSETIESLNELPLTFDALIDITNILLR